MKRAREHHVNSPLVGEVFSGEARPDGAVLADSTREVVAGEVAIIEEGKLMLVDEIQGDSLVGRRVHRNGAFLENNRAFLTQDRVMILRSKAQYAQPQPELKFFIHSNQKRIERIGAPPMPTPDVSVGARVVLSPYLWPDESLLQKHNRRREVGRASLLARKADPATFPYAHLRSPDAGFAGEPDVFQCACLGIVVSPTHVRKMMRGELENELVWTEELVAFSSALANFGPEFWWANGPEPCVAAEPPPGPSPRLRTMDVFAGCGGLMQGLYQSGLCDHGWAVEYMPEACASYEINYPQSTVYKADCNDVLEGVLAGDPKYPAKGQVQAIVGGPPCQGFSNMNRFKDSKEYKQRNTLVSTFLSLCDFYRPRLIMIENVPAFISMDKGRVLQNTVECLLRMDYQVTFDVLQAGQHGTPQGRKRFILVAVPLAERLPCLPTPTHTFGKWATAHSMQCGPTKFTLANSTSWAHPPRTLRDAIGDLNTDDGTYSSEPTCSYQRWMRRGAPDKPTLHVPKRISAIHQARVDRLPVDCMGADWRDLPDLEIDLADGTRTEKLKRDAQGWATDENQKLTIIPWCAAHTAHKNSNWGGLYGRLQWEGFFPTTLTESSPTAKQGCVVHPERARFVTYRELARSQGFPDSYVFCGSPSAQITQIGNAVPIPLAKAIGCAFAQSF
jgi:DNA-cytosine methyltransferase